MSIAMLRNAVFLSIGILLVIAAGCSRDDPDAARAQEQAEVAGREAREALEAAGEAAASGAEVAGREVREAAEDMGDAAKRAGERIENETDEAANEPKSY